MIRNLRCNLHSMFKQHVYLLMRMPLGMTLFHKNVHNFAKSYVRSGCNFCMFKGEVSDIHCYFVYRYPSSSPQTEIFYSLLVL